MANHPEKNAENAVSQIQLDFLKVHVAKFDTHFQKNGQFFPVAKIRKKSPIIPHNLAVANYFVPHCKGSSDVKCGSCHKTNVI